MSKEIAVAKLVPVFRQYGYEGTSLSLLSKAAGLGKASLYHYFPGGKAEMAEAVLAHVGQFLQTHIFDPLQADGDPYDRVQNMVQGIQTFYRNGQDACLLAVFSTGEADGLFHSALQKSLKKWIEQLSAVLVEVGNSPTAAAQQAQDTIMRIQGALVLVRVLGSTQPFEDLMERLPRLLTQQLEA